MTLIYSNGTLTTIATAPTPDNGDEPGTPGFTRWAGAEPVTVREVHAEELTQGRIDQVDQTHLVVDYDLGRIIQRGDLLTYTYEGADATRVAGTIAHAALSGRVRVMLQDG